MTNEGQVARSRTYTGERHAGALASAAWAASRGLHVPIGATWDVAIALAIGDQPASPAVTNPLESRFHIAIAANEWGFFFCHHEQVSWIRVTDVPAVHEHDAYGLLDKTPPLRDLGTLVRSLEDRHGLRFRRDRASIRATNLPDPDRAIRLWLAAAI